MIKHNLSTLESLCLPWDLHAAFPITPSPLRLKTPLNILLILSRSSSSLTLPLLTDLFSALSVLLSDFLEHSNDFHLSNEKLIFIGHSCGAHMAALLVLSGEILRNDFCHCNVE